MNPVGLTAAAATFFGVWVGHVAVRKIEFRAKSLRLPATILVVVGLGLEFWSLASANLLVSIAAGILGVTVLFDALELTRQEKRVKKGHAPANPRNPRHALILNEFPSATTIDLVKNHLSQSPQERQADRN